MNIRLSAVAALLCVGFASVAVGYDTIWSLQQVNELGQGTHPNLEQSTERIAIRGVVLNTSTDFLPVAAPWGPAIWQVYVQAIAPATGGVAVFEGYYAGNQGAALHELNIEAGDIVDVTGFLGFHNGKSNINTRHGGVDLFEITIVEKNAGMPEPREIPSIADCNYFDSADEVTGMDQYRRRGGENYQAQWCRLRNVYLLEGTWGPGETVTVTDDSGEPLSLLLSEMADFNETNEPIGAFDVVGVFDQEDDNTDGDYHELYRLWVKRPSAISQKVLYGDVNGDEEVNNLDALMIHSRFLGLLDCFAIDLNCDGYGSGDVLYGDVSGDGEVNNLDALMTQSRFLGVIDCFAGDTDCDGYGPEASR